MINRTCRILKCRHGKGSGARIGLTWGNDVIFREVGVISTAAKPKGNDRPTPQHSRAEKLRRAPSPDEDRFADMEGA